MKLPPALRDVLASPMGRALLALLLMLFLGCVFHHGGAFFQWSTHRGMLRDISVLGMLACGMTVVVISGGIDLSVSSVLAVAAVAFSVLAMPLGIPSIPAALLVVAGGTALGALNGALVARFGIQPFVVTLASMVFARGLAKVLSGGKKVTSWVVDASGVGREVPHPGAFELLDATVLADNLAIVTLVFAACVLSTWLILERLRLGRHLYAIGGNPEAARLAGVPVSRALVLAYALSGAFAALAGICQAAAETHGDPETGKGYELTAIAMVVIGGTSLMGGRGGIALTLVGALTIGYLEKILSINAFSTEARQMLTGVIIVCAVLFQRQRRMGG